MITHINNYTFKSFKNYTGPIETPFKEKNILFGYNGKGKSSLSKGILDEYKKEDSVTENDYRFFWQGLHKKQFINRRIKWNKRYSS